MGEVKQLSSMLTASIETIVENKFNELMTSAFGGVVTNGAASVAARPATPKVAAEKPTGRLPRRSAEEISSLAGEVAALLKKNPDGMRAEDIRITMGWDQREVPRVLKAGLDEKLFKIIAGQKRSTTYGIKVGTAKPKAAKAKAPKSKAKAVKKAPKKAEKPSAEPAKAAE